MRVDLRVDLIASGPASGPASGAASGAASYLFFYFFTAVIFFSNISTLDDMTTDHFLPPPLHAVFPTKFF